MAAKQWVVSTLTIRLSLRKRLHVLRGQPVEVRIGHEGLVGKLIVFVGNEEIGSYHVPQDGQVE